MVDLSRIRSLRTPCLVPFTLYLTSLIGVGVGVIGCTKNEPAVALQVQVSSEPVSLDPALSEDGISMKILHNVMDGLVGYGRNGELEGRLAESWTVTEDGKRYEFVLREGVKWSDGVPVRAEDFVFAFRRALSARMGAKLASMLFPIKGARELHAGKAAAGDTGVQGLAVFAPDTRKLVIELSEPAPYFLHALTLLIAMPAREDALAQSGGRWTEQTPVTGPYRIISRKVDQEIVLEGNPHYWNAGRGGGAWQGRSPGRVLLRIVQDESTAASLFEQGKLDILIKVPAYDLERFRSKGALHVDPYVATYFLAFNTRKPPFNDREWRRAVSGSVLRTEVTRALGSGETPARSWIPKGLEGHISYEDPAPVFAESVKQVKAALAARGREAGLREVVASFDTSGRNTTVMEKIQNDLRERLGLRVKLQNMDWKTYVGRLGVDPAPIYRFGWLAPFNDPIMHLQAFTSNDPNNYTGWKSEEYDRLVREIARMEPGADREKKVVEAQTLLVDQEAVVVPIYHYVQTHAVSERVKNFRVNPFGVVRFNELSL